MTVSSIMNRLTVNQGKIIMGAVHNAFDAVLEDVIKMTGNDIEERKFSK
jgi:hypothetical protein